MSSKVRNEIQNPLCFFCLLLVLAACATPYEPKNWGYGFDETRVGENTWVVSFRGNDATDDQRAYDFALLRSAHLTRLNGYQYFHLQSSTSSQEQDFYAYEGTGGSSVYPTQRNTISMFHNNPEGIYYAADFICDSLGKKYDLSCD